MNSDVIGRQHLLSILACFALAILYGLYHIHFGVDLRDEGLYLASPMRYALGDLPFRDEFLNSHRMFDVVLWPLFLLLPEITVLELRFLWLIIQIITVVLFFRLFRRFAPGPLVALSCVATLYLSNWIWTPAYHLMGVFGFVLTFSLWLTGCLALRATTQLVLGALSGVVFFIAAVSYLPLLAVAVVPTVVLLTALRTLPRHTGRLVASAALLVTLLLLSLLALGALLAFDLLPDWLAAQERILHDHKYAQPLMVKVSVFATGIGIGWGVMLASAVSLLFFLFIAKATRSHSTISVWVVTLPAGLFSVVVLAALYWLGTGLEPNTCSPAREGFRLLFPTMIAMGLHGGLVVWARTKGSERLEEPNWSLVYGATTSGAFLMAFLFGYLGTHAFKMSFFILPLFVPAVAAVYRSSSIAPRQTTGSNYTLLGGLFFCVVVGLSSYSARWNCVYGDWRLSYLTTEFSTPRLKGIKSTPKKVAALDGLVTYLSPRLARGDLLLVAGPAPLIYYLTETRPALDHSWWLLQLPIAVLEESLLDMQKRSRFPEYIVRVAVIGSGELKQRDEERWEKIRDALPSNYSPGERFGRFVIWEKDE